MSKSKQQAPRGPVCVVDETIDHGKWPYRIVIWRGEGTQSIVVFEGLVENAAPDIYASGLAMRVLREYLGYALPMPIWFHRSTVNGTRRSFRVNFEVNGHKLRPWLSEPSYQPAEHATLDSLLKP